MMTEERKGKIALRVAYAAFREEGIHLCMGTRNEIKNMAADLGVHPDEAAEFMKEMVLKLVEEIFAPPSEEKK